MSGYERLDQVRFVYVNLAGPLRSSCQGRDIRSRPNVDKTTDWQSDEIKTRLENDTGPTTTAQCYKLFIDRLIRLDWLV